MLYFVYFIQVRLKIWTSDGRYCFASNINLKIMLVESECDVIQIKKSLWFSWLYKSALSENIFKVPYIIWRCCMNMDIFNFSELIMFSSKTATCICIWKLERKKGDKSRVPSFLPNSEYYRLIVIKETIYYTRYMYKCVQIFYGKGSNIFVGYFKNDAH